MKREKRLRYISRKIFNLRSIFRYFLKAKLQLRPLKILLPKFGSRAKCGPKSKNLQSARLFQLVLLQNKKLKEVI